MRHKTVGIPEDLGSKVENSFPSKDSFLVDISDERRQIGVEEGENQQEDRVFMTDRQLFIRIQAFLLPVHIVTLLSQTSNNSGAHVLIQEKRISVGISMLRYKIQTREHILVYHHYFKQ